MAQRRFDYIVVGGGAAGAVLARRLADGGAGSVALLEEGPSDEGLAEVADHSRYKEVVNGPLSRRLATKAVSGTDNAIVFPLGRVLGGCTSHNTCIWFRPPDSDFAAWEAAGAAGWGPRDLDPAYAALLERVAVSTWAPANETQAALLRAGLESGFAQVDFAGPFGAGIGLYRLNADGRRRLSASVSFLHPLDRLPPNLAVFTGVQALRLLFGEAGQVTGVATDAGDILADGEVILSAGAIGTPRLLLLSGIGPADELRALGLPVRRDLPGVGRHLLDHPAATVDVAVRRPLDVDPVWPYGSVVFATVAERGAPWPDIEIQLGPEAVPGEPQPALSAYMTVNRARSEGTVRLSSPDPRVDPLIDPNYLGDPEGYDLAVLLGGVELSRRLLAAPALAPWAAAELRPGSGSSAAEIEAYLRQTLQTGYHPAGTCRMGAVDDPRAVVGPDLRVRGLRNLRVADASVFPTLASVNIQVACMLVGARAAELIAAG